MAKKIIMLDGAAGTSLWEKATDKVPVWRYNIENPKIVRELNEEYVEAGSDIILANTFAANGAEVARSSSYTVEQVVTTAMKIAQDASNGRAKVGLAAGPLTGLLKPYGKITREEAKDMYEELIGAGMQEKPDLIYLLTFMDLEMLKIAAEAASHYDEPLSGIAVGASVDGIRPYLIEVQALVSNAAYGTPHRTATGYDAKRMNMLLAELEKRVGMKMFAKDVFLNFAGGFKVSDTGLDLAIVAAVISSYFDRPIADGTCCAGEIGLSGEGRPAPRTEQRISEAARLGFRRIIVSSFLRKEIKNIRGIEIICISNIGELPRSIFCE